MLKSRTMGMLATMATVGALVVGGASATAAASTPDAPNADTATFVQNRSLTIEEANDRLTELSKQYTKVGDRLSAADAEFIKIYAIGGSDPVLDGRSDSSAMDSGMVQPMGTTTHPFTRSGSGANGSATIFGNGSLTIGPGISNSWSIAYTSVAEGTVNKIQNCVHVKAYGAVGSGGVGLVYYTDPCATTNGQYSYFQRGTSYTAFAAYATMQAATQFYTPTGSFQVTS